MKWWKKFWRIRKQEDRVKIVLLLFLLGIVFLFYGVYNGICLYQAVQTPVEYVLAGDSGEQNLGRKLNEIREWENMAGASIFRESSVLITYQGEETTFSCVELSEEYIKDVYGISQSGATKTFYMNQKAFDMVKETNEAFSYKQSGSEDTLRMTYETEEAEEGQTQLPEKERKEKKTAEIVRVKEGVNEEEPFVFSAGEKGILIKYGMGIRVCFKGQYGWKPIKKNTGSRPYGGKYAGVSGIGASSGRKRTAYKICCWAVHYLPVLCLYTVENKP